MLFVKITHGYVKQTFNDAGEFLSQEFIAGDEVEYETEDGYGINQDDMPLAGREYQPFDMANANLMKQELESLRESIQEDLLSRLDGLDEPIMDDVCQIVVDRVNDVLAKVSG